MLCSQGGAIVLKEVSTHWSDNLIPSPNKKDLVFQHVKGPRMHVYIQQPNGGKKYVCSEGAQCKSHQRHFMKNTTTALFKHFLQQYPLRRGMNQTAFFLYWQYVQCKARTLCFLDRNSYVVFVSEIKAVLCVQAFTSVSVIVNVLYPYYCCNTCFYRKCLCMWDAQSV